MVSSTPEGNGIQMADESLADLVNAPETTRDRLGSRVWGEKDPPRFRVQKRGKKSEHLVPVRRFGPDGVGRPVLWARYPHDPSVTAVEIYDSTDAGNSIRIIYPFLEKSTEHTVADGAGVTLMTLKSSRIQSVFLTSWKISDAQGRRVLVIRERIRDAIWRRTTRPFTNLTKWDLDWLSMIGLPFILMKPRNRMSVRAQGKRIGTLSAVSAVALPRDDFSLYLNDGVTDDDLFIFTAAFAVMQKMR